MPSCSLECCVVLCKVYALIRLRQITKFANWISSKLGEIVLTQNSKSDKILIH